MLIHGSPLEWSEWRDEGPSCLQGTCATLVALIVTLLQGPNAESRPTSLPPVSSGKALEKIIQLRVFLAVVLHWTDLYQERKHTNLQHGLWPPLRFIKTE